MEITASAKGLTLVGSCEDISIILNVPKTKDNGLSVTADDNSSIVVPAKFFTSVVKSLPSDTMSFELEDDYQVHIKSGDSAFTINGLDADNFPHLPKLDGKQFTLSVNKFTELINDVSFNASTQESRPVITGVHLVAGKGEMVAVCTDSHRLGVEKSHALADNVTFNVNLPAKNLNELLKQVKGQKEISVTLAKQQSVFKFGDMTFYSRLLTGNYPEVKPLIPTSSTTQMTVDKGTLLSALEQTAILSHASRNNVVQLKITADGKLQVSADSPDVGKTHEDFSGKITGKAITISFNPDYIIDALKPIHDKSVTMKFNGAVKPFVLVPSSKNPTHFIQLATPVRTY